MSVAKRWFYYKILEHFSSLSHVQLFATPWTTALQASLSTTNSRSLLKLMSIKLVMPSNHLILCRPLLFLPSTFPSIRVFSNESALLIRWPKYWSFSFSTSPSNEHSGLISFRMDWLDLLAVQGTLKSLLQHHSLKASILWCSTPSLNHQHRVFSSWPIRTRLHAQLQLEGTLWGQMPASPSSSDSWKETGTWRKARTCVWRQPYDGSAWSVQSWVAKPVSLGDGLLETSGPTMKCKDTKLLIYRMREFHTLGFQSLENLRVVQSTAVIF